MTAGFGTFGGQRNASFPMRQNAPQQRVVTDPFAGMGGASGWEGDWQNRFNQEASQARAATPGTLALQRYNGSNFDENMYLDLYPEVAAAVDKGVFGTGRDHFDQYENVFGPLSVNRAMTGGDAGYTPDFSGLNAEKDRLQPMAQNQIRQQQSFDQMRGFGQENAVMGPEYTQAGFGQVSGQANPYGAEMGAGQAMLDGAVDGVSNSFMSGVYDPTTQQATGAYKPPGSVGGLGGLGGMFR